MLVKNSNSSASGGQQTTVLLTGRQDKRLEWSRPYALHALPKPPCKCRKAHQSFQIEHSEKKIWVYFSGCLIWEIMAACRP